MKIWNQTLSKAEALEIYQYKGTAYYPRTEHNSKVMAEVVREHLNQLRDNKII